MKDELKNKRVLLFSGGMDSLIANYLISPDICLVIPIDSSYEEREMRCIEELMFYKDIDSNKVIIHKGLNLKQFERLDFIIPNRNVYFITIATHYGETIFLSSVHGDRSLDKDEKFFSLCESLFNHIFDNQHWCKKRIFSISAPFKDLTKTQLVKRYLEYGGNVEALFRSYSCYTGQDKHCGWCKPCFRKWIALVNNNIQIPTDYFISSPSEFPEIKSILFSISQGQYRGKEDKEIIRALKK